MITNAKCEPQTSCAGRGARVFATLVWLAVVWTGAGVAGAQTRGVRYEPTWASIDSRPVPAWYTNAKFGIFIHWGVYAVPAWAPGPADGKVTGSEPYAEWYWKKLEKRKGATWDFHTKTYGADFKYQDFAAQFRAELFRPEQWADVFARSGARYVVLTSKHHDGFTLWGSEQSKGWNAVDTGPRRDLAGDLTQAVRARGLKMGFYYSLYEWYHPLYTKDANDPRLRRYVGEHMLPQMRDLVRRYEPSLLWTDGEWEHTGDVWRSREFLAELYNTAANRDEIVVNDRWGKDTRSKHGGFLTTEYGTFHSGSDSSARKWEECRGMGTSFGYNRNEAARDYRSSRELIRVLVDTVSRGGNLLLDIGPAADGTIPVVMEERLLDIGAWLGVNGESIYDTTAWRVAKEDEHIYYTRKGADVYAITFTRPTGTLSLRAPRATPQTRVTLLGRPQPLRHEAAQDALRIEMPPAAETTSAAHALVFKLTNVE